MLTMSNITEAPVGASRPQEVPVSEYKAAKRNRLLTHPGAVVKVALEAMGVSVYQAAIDMEWSREGLNKVVNQRGPVTVDGALLLAAYFGTGEAGAEHLLTMQRDHDLWQARQELKPRLDKVARAGRERRAVSPVARR